MGDHSERTYPRAHEQSWAKLSEISGDVGIAMALAADILNVSWTIRTQTERSATDSRSVYLGDGRVEKDRG